MMTATTKVLIVLMFTLLEKKRTSQLTKLLFRYRKQQSISECQVTHSHFEWSLSLTISSATSIRNCCQLAIDVVFTLPSSTQNQLRSWLQSIGSKKCTFRSSQTTLVLRFWAVHREFFNSAIFGTQPVALEVLIV